MDEALKAKGLSFSGAKVSISGSGNVAIFAHQKATELGATVITMSDSDGYIHDPAGVNLDTVKEIKLVKRGRISEYVKEHPAQPYCRLHTASGQSPVISHLPCATKNEIDAESAAMLIQNGCKAVRRRRQYASTLIGV
jgi:glutamate dehydrogenase (NADP+)